MLTPFTTGMGVNTHLFGLLAYAKPIFVHVIQHLIKRLNQLLMAFYHRTNILRVVVGYMLGVGFEFIRYIHKVYEPHNPSSSGFL